MGRHHPRVLRGNKNIPIRYVAIFLNADWQRVYFTGRIPNNSTISSLNLSRVLVYPTYPFVLSESLLEAMSAGGEVLVSDAAPVLEVIRQGEAGLLTDFFDYEALAEGSTICLMTHCCGRGWGKWCGRDYSKSLICKPSVCRSRWTGSARWHAPNTPIFTTERCHLARCHKPYFCLRFSNQNIVDSLKFPTTINTPKPRSCSALRCGTVRRVAIKLLR